MKIDTLKFEDYEELVCFVCDKFDEIKENDGDVTVIAKYNDAKEILKELLCIGHNVISFDIHMPEWEGYKDPYSITICNDGIWCTKAKNENNEYYDELSDVVYIFSDCSSAILKKIETKYVYEVSVGLEDDSCDGDCDNCDCKNLDTDSSEYTHVSREKDGKITGFTKSWSDTKNGISYYSSYSHYSTDEDSLRKVAEDFGIRL